MKEFLSNTYQFSLLIGTFFLIVGWITHRFPPKKINVLYGYRTPSSMRNQETWDFAQPLASQKMMRLGLVLIAVGFSKYLLKFDYEMLISLSTMLLGLLYLVLSTERAIRNKFK